MKNDQILTKFRKKSGIKNFIYLMNLNLKNNYKVNLRVLAEIIRFWTFFIYSFRFFLIFFHVSDINFIELITEYKFILFSLIRLNNLIKL